jgi:hypothetical protein
MDLSSKIADFKSAPPWEMFDVDNFYLKYFANLGVFIELFCYGTHVLK